MFFENLYKDSIFFVQKIFFFCRCLGKRFHKLIIPDWNFIDGFYFFLSNVECTFLKKDLHSINVFFI